MAEQEGFAPPLGCLPIPERLFPRPAQVTHRFIVDGGDVDWGEVARAHEPGEWHGITPVGFDAVTCLFRHQGGGDAPADVALLHPVALEPIPTRAGFRDQDQVLGLRVELPHQGVDVTLPGATSSEGNNLGIVIFSDVGHSDRLFRHIQADVKRARLLQS